MNDNILITGATGTVGTSLIPKLSQKRVSLFLGSRNPEQVDTDASNTLSIHVDLLDKGSIEKALDKVDRIFLVTPLDPRMVEMTKNVVEVSKDKGVKGIVKLSVLHADSDADIKLWEWHGQAEEIIRSSGLDYAFLRPANFMQNFINFYRETIRDDDTFYLPHGDAKVSLIDVKDIASAAVSVLLQEKMGNQSYELTGPVLTKYEVAEIFSEVLGREIKYIDVPEETAESSMLDSGMPEWMVEVFMEFNAKCKEGILNVHRADLEILINDTAASFEEFVNEHISFFKNVSEKV